MDVPRIFHGPMIQTRSNRTMYSHAFTYALLTKSLWNLYRCFICIVSFSVFLVCATSPGPWFQPVSFWGMITTSGFVVDRQLQHLAIFTSLCPGRTLSVHRRRHFKLPRQKPHCCHSTTMTTILFAFPSHSIPIKYLFYSHFCAFFSNVNSCTTMAFYHPGHLMKSWPPSSVRRCSSREW